MNYSFNYYDLLAHIVPGATLLALMYYYKISIVNNSNSAVELFFIIVLSFVFGHALSFFSKYIVGLPLKIEGNHPIKYTIMNELFQKDNEKGIIFDTLGIDEKLEDKKNIYRKTVAYARNRGIDIKAEVHKSLYGFYRSMVLCAFIVLILALHQCIILFSIENLLICIIVFLILTTFVFRTKQQEIARIEKIFYCVVIDIKAKINIGA